MRWIIFLLALVSMTANGSRGLTVNFKDSESATAPNSGSMQLYSDSYALVIGIDDYVTWPRLSQAIDDAEQVAAVLRKKGFEVTLKKNLNGRDLQTAFEDFFIDKGANPDARLFVWYAGHGHTVDGEGFLIPADGVLETDRSNFLRRSVSLRDFGKFSRLAQSKHVYAIFDSCFAGTIFNVARSAPPPAITRVTSEPVRQFLTSGDAGQTVSDDGTFARLFVEALEGKRRADLNGDGYVTAEELGAFLTTSISNYTENKQVPRHGKLRDPSFDKGDFVFVQGEPIRDQDQLTTTADTSSSTRQFDAEEEFWSAIKDSEFTQDFEDYLDAYPDGRFQSIARIKLRQLTTKPGEPQPQLSWSRWLTAAEYTVLWEQQRSIKHYPIQQEGRLNQGVREYRGIWGPYEPNPFWFSSWIGLPPSAYAEKFQEYVGNGYREVAKQTFNDSDGQARIQVIFVKP